MKTENLETIFYIVRSNAHTHWINVGWILETKIAPILSPIFTLHWSNIVTILACRVLATASTLQESANIGPTLAFSVGPLGKHCQPILFQSRANRSDAKSSVTGIAATANSADHSGRRPAYHTSCITINEYWQPAPPSYPGGLPLEYRSRPGYVPSPVHRPVLPVSGPLCRSVQHRHSTTSPRERVKSRGVIKIANLGTRANLFPNPPDYREGSPGSQLTSGHHQPSPSLRRRES